MATVRLEQQVAQLEEVVRRQHEALRESTKLLLKCRPARLPVPHDRKLLTAASQRWKCANPYGTCLLFEVSDGTFDDSLFEVDHVEAYSVSYRSVGNLQALCGMCHNKKTRLERLRALERDEAEG